MLSNKYIRGQIRKIALDLNMIPAEDWAWEGREFDPTDKELFIREKLLMIGTIAKSDKLKDNFLHGSMIFSVIARPGKGTEELEDIAAQLINAYSLGLVINLNNTYELVVENTSTGDIIKDDDFLLLPCTIRFNVTLI